MEDHLLEVMLLVEDHLLEDMEVHPVEDCLSTPSYPHLMEEKVVEDMDHLSGRGGLLIHLVEDMVGPLVVMVDQVEDLVEDVRLFLSNIVEQFRSSSAGQCQDRSAELSTSSSAPLYPGKCARVLRSSSAGVFPDTSVPVSLNNNVLNSADQLLGAKSVTEPRVGNSRRP